jgi:hypothetical protein
MGIPVLSKITGKRLYRAVLSASDWGVYVTNGKDSLELLYGLGGRLAFEICDHMNGKMVDHPTIEAVWFCWLIDQDAPLRLDVLDRFKGFKPHWGKSMAGEHAKPEAVRA